MGERKTFKILAIDGGGIKGLYSALILKQFEEKFECLTSDCFDMICGTSTGGLIALAAALKIPASEIAKFYTEHGESIFPKHKKYKVPFLGKIDTGLLKQALKGGKYNSKYLKLALSNIFGNKVVGDSNNLLCIPSYSITRAKPTVFRYNHLEGELSRDNDKLMIDIALATTAAPTYFPIAELDSFDGEQFIDGGVWANNPTLIGLLEALRYFVGRDKNYDKVQILSLSSLSISGGKPPGLKNERSFLDWKGDLFETSMTGQSFFSNFFLETIKEIADTPIDYLRIPSAAIDREHESLIQLDVANKKAFNLMKIKAAEQALIFEKHEKIRGFFTTPKTYII